MLRLRATGLRYRCTTWVPMERCSSMVKMMSVSSSSWAFMFWSVSLSWPRTWNKRWGWRKLLQIQILGTIRFLGVSGGHGQYLVSHYYYYHYIPLLLTANNMALRSFDSWTIPSTLWANLMVIREIMGRCVFLSNRLISRTWRQGKTLAAIMSVWSRHLRHRPA